MCEEGSGDYIARVDEPQSCSYVLTVHTTRICHHPFLRPPSTGATQSIKCHPALSPEQYVEYVKAQVSDTKRIVEELSEELKTLNLKTLASKTSTSAGKVLNRNEILESQPDQPEQQNEETDNKESENVETREDEDQRDKEQEDTESDFWKKVQRPEDRKTDMAVENHQNGDPDDENQDIRKGLKYKIIRNPEDLMNFIAELKKKKKTKEDKKDAEQKKLPSSHGEEDMGSSPETQSEDEKDEQELLQEFEKELENILLPKSDISQIKENMEKEFDNIIEEAQGELETEGLKGEFDRKQASKSLATTLNKLIDKLDNTVDDKGDETEAAESDDHVTKSISEPISKEPSDGRVKVRVTKIQRGSTDLKERKVKEMSSDSSQLRHVENVVKDLLEKEGLKAEGKIEIKILTTGGFGDEESFSDEDTKNLQDIIFNILVRPNIEGGMISVLHDILGSVMLTTQKDVMARRWDRISYIMGNVGQCCYVVVSVDRTRSQCYSKLHLASLFAVAVVNTKGQFLFSGFLEVCICHTLYKCCLLHSRLKHGSCSLPCLLDNQSCYSTETLLTQCRLFIVYHSAMLAIHYKLTS
ncbi:hypothetical protein GDO86_004367 [Hymenochirus boettgeri]|uniref:Endoplasmic reticulum lectin n=1 Tax=Hymenochirus boettgeri TaxID=247094 RepID=A0A8T2KAA4_9PIPI|nr:hypothetical protein GDO86_004367 [Hymenochirus boettgeri]